MSFDTLVTESRRIALKELQGICLDISDAGLGISTEHAMEKGQVLEIYIPFEDMDTTVTIPVFAEVMWSISDNDHFRVGVRFLGNKGGN